MRAALATIASVGCLFACDGEPPQPATSPPVSAAQLQFSGVQTSIMEFAELKGYMIDVGGGNWCVGGPDEYFMDNDTDSCLSLKGDTIQDVFEPDRRVRSATISTKFHSPKPMPPSGAPIAIIDSEIRVDCIEQAAWLHTGRLYNPEGDLVLTQTLDPQPPMPDSELSGALVKFVCR